MLLYNFSLILIVVVLGLATITTGFASDNSLMRNIEENNTVIPIDSDSGTVHNVKENNTTITDVIRVRTSKAIFRIYNKEATSVVDIYVDSNGINWYRRLGVELHSCIKGDINSKLGDFALVSLFYGNDDNAKEQIFYGWLYEMSMNISSPQNRSYMVSLVDCRE